MKVRSPRRTKPRQFDERTCQGKTRWGSEKTAQVAATRIKRESPDQMDSTVRPYRCSFCKKWHLGHGA